MKLPILQAILLLTLARALGAEDTGALVDKVVATYGGSLALEQLGAFREEGQVQGAMRATNSRPVVRTFARDLKLRIEVGQAPHFSEVRVLNGAKGWRGGKEVTGASYEAMVLQAVRLDLPWQLLRHKQELVEKAPAERAGQHLRVLELPLEGGLSVSAGIDPLTGHIIFSSGTTKTDSITFETSYEDFRTVNGALFAFKEINMAQGTKTAETTLSKIEPLKQPPDEAFKP